MKLSKILQSLQLPTLDRGKEKNTVENK